MDSPGDSHFVDFWIRSAEVSPHQLPPPSPPSINTINTSYFKLGSFLFFKQSIKQLQKQQFLILKQHTTDKVRSSLWLVHLCPFFNSFLPFPACPKTTIQQSYKSLHLKEKSYSRICNEKEVENLTSCFTNLRTSFDECFLSRFTCLPISVSYTITSTPFRQYTE